MPTLLEGRLTQYSAQIADAYNVRREPNLSGAETAVGVELVRKL